ncbi:MAG: sulfatase-like hydrolase/transferase [bacterium]
MFSNPFNRLLKILQIAAALLSALFFAGCTGKKPAPGMDYNILLITIDTLRADHLACYGSREVKTPNIDALANRGVLFEHAESQAPVTLPSHTSIMTGTLPPYHGIMDNGVFYVRDSQITMAEILKDHGYTTGAIVSTFVLDRQFGLDQGFDSYDDKFNSPGEPKVKPLLERQGDKTTEAAIEWLRKNQSRKFFLWLHFFDPHFSYSPPSPYKDEYAQTPYDGEVAFTDECLGRIFSTLKESGMDKKTLIILTADHGEGLQEHGEANHSYFVYESTLHIPLIFSAPAVLPRERRVHGIVRSIDILPTTLDFLGFKIPDHIQGVSLIPMLSSGSDDLGLESYGEAMPGHVQHGWSALRSLRSKEWKFINAPKPELYRMTDDPSETRNLIKEEPATASAMKERLKQVFKRSIQNASKESPAKNIDPETRSRLESLGYIAGAGKAEPLSKLSFDPTGTDPKEMKDFIEENGLAQGYIAISDYEEAFLHVQKALQLDPDNLNVQLLKAQALLELGRLDESIEILETLKKRRPDFSYVHIYLATAYFRKGDMKNADLETSEVIKLLPKKADAYYSLGIVKQKLGELAAAEGLVKKAVDLDPENSLYRNFLATELMRQSRFDEAALHLKKVLEIDPSLSEVRFKLAACLLQLNLVDQAIEELKKGIATHPDSAQAKMILGVAYLKKDALDMAQKSLTDSLKLDAGNADAWYNYACVKSRLGNTQDALNSLGQAIRLGGEKYRQIAKTDDDLKSISGDKKFHKMIKEP